VWSQNRAKEALTYKMPQILLPVMIRWSIPLEKLLMKPLKFTQWLMLSLAQRLHQTRHWLCAFAGLQRNKLDLPSTMYQGSLLLRSLKSTAQYNNFYYILLWNMTLFTHCMWSRCDKLYLKVVQYENYCTRFGASSSWFFHSHLLKKLTFSKSNETAFWLEILISLHW